MKNIKILNYLSNLANNQGFLIIMLKNNLLNSPSRTSVHMTFELKMYNIFLVPSEIVLLKKISKVQKVHRETEVNEMFPKASPF